MYGEIGACRVFFSVSRAVHPGMEALFGVRCKGDVEVLTFFGVFAAARAGKGPGAKPSFDPPLLVPAAAESIVIDPEQLPFLRLCK